MDKSRAASASNQSGTNGCCSSVARANDSLNESGVSKMLFGPVTKPVFVEHCKGCTRFTDKYNKPGSTIVRRWYHNEQLRGMIVNWQKYYIIKN